MFRFILRRLLTFPLVLLAVYGGAVLLIMAAPGSGLESEGKELAPEVLEAKEIAFNYKRRIADPATGVSAVVDVPSLERYFWIWPRRLLWDGDLPTHRYEDWTVVDILRGTLPVSFQLGLLALAFAVLIGVGAGVIAAVNRGRWIDHASVGLALIGVSLPSFVVGAVLLILFGLWLRVAPVGGWGSPAQAILPALTLALPYAAYIARLTRSSLIEAYSEDYIRTARAKGLSERRILFEHALRNALLPVLSYLGPAAAAIFTGSFVVEKIFTIPGVGTHVVEAINNRDQSLILAIVLIYATFLSAFNLIVDLLYGVLDPRIRVNAG
ncbi:MAG: ABC transporter permease [Phycisphaerales bacterium]|nr:ABC transporter permease [Phycisphaerales bacterium]